MKKSNYIWVIHTGAVLPDGCEIIRGTLLSDYAEHNELGPEDVFETKAENLGPEFKWKLDAFMDKKWPAMFWPVSSDDAGNSKHFNDLSEAKIELVKMLTPKLNIYLNGIRENISNYNRLMNRIKSIVEDNNYELQDNILRY